MSTTQTLYTFDTEQGRYLITFQQAMNDAQMTTTDAVGGELMSRIDPLKSPAVLVDLSQLSYIGSAMVALIVRLWKAIKTRDGRMVVVTNHPSVLEVLKIAGLDKVWKIVDTRDAGLRELGIRERRAAGETAASADSGTGSGGMVLVGLGLLALLAAGAALALFFVELRPEQQIVTDREALIIALACAAFGVILGGIAALRQRGGKRLLGGLVLAGSAAVIVVGVLRFPGVAQADVVPPQDRVPPQNVPAE